MAIETSAGAAYGFKAGLFGALAMGLVSILAVLIGFTVVPLAPGNEHQDATRRLGAGLLCSFTLGPPMAIKFLEWQPSILAYWMRVLGAGNEIWAYLMGALPFVSVTALAGFWIVAGFMRWFTNRQGQDIAQMAGDATKAAKDLVP
ncbi:MAG: hypothetical protein QM762_08710 [Chryseolinea sp.]